MYSRCTCRKLLAAKGSKDLENLHRAIREDCPIIIPKIAKDAYDNLLEGQVKPDVIDPMLISHMHFDHVRDVAMFRGANVHVRPGSCIYAASGYPTIDTSPFDGTVSHRPKFADFEKSVTRENCKTVSWQEREDSSSNISSALSLNFEVYAKSVAGHNAEAERAVEPYRY